MPHVDPKGPRLTELQGHGIHRHPNYVQRVAPTIQGRTIEKLNPMGIVLVIQALVFAAISIGMGVLTCVCSAATVTLAMTLGSPVCVLTSMAAYFSALYTYRSAASSCRQFQKVFVLGAIKSVGLEGFCSYSKSS